MLFVILKKINKLQSAREVETLVKGLRADFRLFVEAWVENSNQVKANLEAILAFVKPDTKAVRIEFFQIINGQKVKVDHMQKQSVDDVKEYMAIPLDKFGNEAKVDGAMSFSSTDESMGLVESTGDNSFKLSSPAGKAGAFKIQAQADADLGEGVEALLGEEDFEMVAGKAVGFKFSEKA